MPSEFGLFSLAISILILLASSNILKGVLHVSRRYSGSVSLFGGFRKATSVFDRLSFTVNESALLVALSGPSGSGKSTLAKFILENEKNATNGAIIWGADNVRTCYMDQHFYLSYDPNKKIEDYIVNCTIGKSRSLSSIGLEELKLPMNRPISTLLESQKRGFEDMGPFLLILDEYCDKDVLSVQTAFLQSLRSICVLDQSSLGQVVIITHSKRVTSMCDAVIILKNGQIYANGRPEKVLKYLPSNMIILD